MFFSALPCDEIELHTYQLLKFIKVVNQVLSTFPQLIPWNKLPTVSHGKAM